MVSGCLSQRPARLDPRRRHRSVFRCAAAARAYGTEIEITTADVLPLSKVQDYPLELDGRRAFDVLLDVAFEFELAVLLLVLVFVLVLIRY